MPILAVDHRLWELTGGVESARRHRVSALLHLLNPQGAPEYARHEFQKDFRRTSAQNILFLDETRSLLELLDREGIQAIPLKGALFALRFYPEIGARPQSDVDVLIHPRDLPKAHDILINSGWHEAFPREYYEGHYHWVYRRQATGCLLEMHWRFKLPGTCEPDLGRVWKNARLIEAEGIKFLAMSSEDLLEYTAVNKATQRYSALLDFVDLSQIITGVPIDWERLLENVRLDLTAGALWFGLVHCRKYLGTPIPRGVLDQLAGSWECLGARGLRRGLSLWGGPLGVPPGLHLGPAGRLYEAALEGRPTAVLSMMKPLLLPSRGRLDLLAGGSYPRYLSRNLLLLGRQILGLRKRGQRQSPTNRSA